jgi:chromosome segregation ATPase
LLALENVRKPRKCPRASFSAFQPFLVKSFTLARRPRPGGSRQEGDARERQLGGELARQAAALEREKERHARELERRTADLERHHNELAAAAERRSAAVAAELSKVARLLEARVVELDAEVVAAAAVAAAAAAKAARESCCGGEAIEELKMRVNELEAVNGALQAEAATREVTVVALREGRTRLEAELEDRARQYQARSCNDPRGRELRQLIILLVLASES